MTTQSINGRTVPMEQVEERVLRNDASGKVTERIIRRYDPQGNALPPARETIEEEKAARWKFHHPEHHLPDGHQREHAGDRKVGDGHA